ncbi:MAG: phosphatidylinositol-specific phospholipase C1-like protein [Pseudomonadota bacterium]
MQRTFVGGALITASILAGCVSPDSASVCDARLNHLQMIGSHNSYKLSLPPEELALIEAQSPDWAVALDYGHVSLSEQLDLGMRQLELDVFYDPDGGRFADPLGPKLSGVAYDRTGLEEQGFKAIHVQDVDARSSCLLFTDCLAEIATWSRANPAHEPLLILVNAKQASLGVPGTVEPLPFDAEAFNALDAEIRASLEIDQLLSPDDVRGDAATLREAILSGGWPSLEESRGQIFFALDESEAVIDVYRRGELSLDGHAMFVNSSDPTASDAAYFTINDPIAAADEIAARVADGFVVRTRADADTLEARAGDRRRLDAALASGAQYISTDYYQPRTEWSDYSAALPSGAVSRSNPVVACGSS